MWNCKVCGKENKASNEFCEQCQTPRDKKVNPSESSSETILCPNCYHLNPIETERCVRCHTTLKNNHHLEAKKENDLPISSPGKPNGIKCPSCGHMNATWRSECEKCKAYINPIAEGHVIAGKIEKKKYNRLSIVVGFSGLAIQFFGYMMGIDSMTLVGSIMFIIGLSYYAKAKGRSPWWGLLGLLSWVGLLILYFLRDES